MSKSGFAEVVSLDWIHCAIHDRHEKVSWSTNKIDHYFEAGLIINKACSDQRRLNTSSDFWAFHNMTREA